MIGLDTSHLATEVTYLLMLRGTDVPPLRWTLRPNEIAKQSLDAMDDAALFGRPTLANETMGAAVRGLLYLWNGWPADCRMISQLAPEQERHYLAALCARHRGQPSAAKVEFQSLGSHVVHEPLARYAIETIGTGDHPALVRFKGVLMQDPVWEPFLFSDLWEQAQAGKLCPASEQLLRRLQAKEFELLFAHCYEKATGESVTLRSAPQPSRARPNRVAGRSAARRRRHQDIIIEPARPTGSAERPQPAAPDVSVRCPKCMHVMTAPASVCGGVAKCAHCGAPFGVPRLARTEPNAARTGPKR